VTISAKILALLEARGPQPICDACLGDYLGLARRSITAAGRTLSAQKLRRFDGRCSGCCTTGKVMARG
jgi:biotin operon repressor